MKLLGHKEPVSAGRAYEFKCQSVGARPPPAITWWKGSIQLKDNITNRVSCMGNFLHIFQKQNVLLKQSLRVCLFKKVFDFV